MVHSAGIPYYGLTTWLGTINIVVPETPNWSKFDHFWGPKSPLLASVGGPSWCRNMGNHSFYSVWITLRAHLFKGTHKVRPLFWWQVLVDMVSSTRPRFRTYQESVTEYHAFGGTRDITLQLKDGEIHQFMMCISWHHFTTWINIFRANIFVQRRYVSNQQLLHHVGTHYLSSPVSTFIVLKRPETFWNTLFWTMYHTTASNPRRIAVGGTQVL